MVTYLASPMVVTQDEAIGIISNFHKVYYDLGNTTVDYFNHFNDEQGKIEPLKLTVSRYKDPSSAGVAIERYDLLPLSTSGGELSSPYERIGFLEKLSSFELNFRIYHCQILYRRICKQWTVNYQLSLRDVPNENNLGYASRGLFDLSYSFEDDDLYGIHRTIVLQLGFSLLILASLSLCSLVLPILINLYKLLARWRSEYQQKLNWNRLNHSWFAFVNGGRGGMTRRSHYSSGVDGSCCSNICNGLLSSTSSAVTKYVWRTIAIARDSLFIASICTILERRTHFVTPIFHANNRILVLAIGVFLGWLSLLPHIKIFGPEYFATLLTLQRVFPFVSKFVLGCLPLFLGYIILGISILSVHTPKFRGIGDSLMTLWAVLNGDWLFDNFQDAAQYMPVLSRIFFYTFMILFIIIISKLALASVEYIFFKAMPDVSDSTKEAHHLKSGKRATNGRRLRPKGSKTNPELVLLNYIVSASNELRTRFEHSVREFQAVNPRFEYLTGVSSKHLSLDRQEEKEGWGQKETDLPEGNTQGFAAHQLIKIFRNRQLAFKSDVFAWMRSEAKSLIKTKMAARKIEQTSIFTKTLSGSSRRKLSTPLEES